MVQSAKTLGVRMLLPAVDAVRNIDQLKTVVRQMVLMTEKGHIQIHDDLVAAEFGGAAGSVEIHIPLVVLAEGKAF